jgi:hypothetical protein
MSFLSVSMSVSLSIIEFGYPNSQVVVMLGRHYVDAPFYIRIWIAKLTVVVMLVRHYVGAPVHIRIWISKFTNTLIHIRIWLSKFTSNGHFSQKLCHVKLQQL